MAMNSGNITKATYQADIKRKQAFFNRCQRRFKVAKTTGEKTFLKNEAKRICTELRMCSKNWKNFGFGGCTWVTKNYNMVNFTTGNKTSRPTASRKTTSNKTSARRTSARRTGTTRTSSRRTMNGSKVRANSRTRSSASRRSYVAW